MRKTRPQTESETMTKRRMITKIRRMQKDMGCPMSRAATLNLEYTEEEVKRSYESLCVTFNHWQRKQIADES